MNVAADAAGFDDLALRRDMHRLEMACQIAQRRRET